MRLPAQKPSQSGEGLGGVQWSTPVKFSSNQVRVQRYHQKQSLSTEINHIANSLSTLCCYIKNLMLNRWLIAI